MPSSEYKIGLCNVGSSKGSPLSSKHCVFAPAHLELTQYPLQDFALAFQFVNTLRCRSTQTTAADRTAPRRKLIMDIRIRRLGCTIGLVKPLCENARRQRAMERSEFVNFENSCNVM